MSCKYVLASMAGFPSTNVPIECPGCSKGNGIKITDDERNLVKAFADSKKKRHKYYCCKKGKAPTKTTAMTSNKTNMINSLFEGSTGSSSMLSGDNTGDSQVHNICGEHTEDLSTNNDYPFLARSLSNADHTKAKGIISDAKNFFQEKLHLLLESEIAARDTNIGYSYDGEVVGSRAAASLSGYTFMNDEI
eukprot:12771904-Ditylum_brightwellii.AAC.1